MTKPTPQLSEADVQRIEARLKSWIAGDISQTQFPASWKDVDALIRDLRALQQKHDRLSEKYRSADVHVAALLNVRCGSGPTHLSIEHSLSVIDGAFGELESQNAALREQLARTEQERDGLSKVYNETKRHAERSDGEIRRFQDERDAALSRLVQVEKEPLRATIDILEQRRRLLGQESIPEYARTINFLQAIIDERAKEYPPLREAGKP